MKHNGYCWVQSHELIKHDRFLNRIKKSVFKVKRYELQLEGYNLGESTWFASKYVEEKYAN